MGASAVRRAPSGTSARTSNTSVAKKPAKPPERSLLAATMVASGPSSWGTRARRASRSGPSRVWVTVGMWAPGGFAGLAGGLGEGGGGQVDHTDRVDLHGAVELGVGHDGEVRSGEHTSELQPLMRI